MPIDMAEWPRVVAFMPASLTISGGIQSLLLPLDELQGHRLLRAPIRKLRWGLRHLTTLEQNVTEIFDAPVNRAMIRADFDMKSGYHVFSVYQVPDVEDFAEHFTNAVADVA